MRSLKLLPLLLAATLASGASAASLKLRDGSVMHVEPSRLQLVVPGRAASAAVDSIGAGLRYSLVEPGGRSWVGMVPGSQGVAVGDASIAQNPVSGDVYAVYSRQASGGSEVVFTGWTGQAFTDSMTLATSPGDDVNPVLSFSEEGDAVLSWNHVDLSSSVYVRHLDLGRLGPTAFHSFSDLGSPDSLIQPSGGVVDLKPGISHVINDASHHAAYLFLASEDREGMGLVRLSLDALIQGGGFNAPPVPVSLSVSAAQSLGTPGTGLGDRPVDSGSLVRPWRLVMAPGITAWYWTETDRLAVVVFRGEVGGKLISAPLPASEELVHATAFQVALRDVARIDRRGAERPLGRHR